MHAELKSRDEKPTVLSLPYIHLQQTVFIQLRCTNARVILSTLQYFASDNHPPSESGNNYNPTTCHIHRHFPNWMRKCSRATISSYAYESSPRFSHDDNSTEASRKLPETIARIRVYQTKHMWSRGASIIRNYKSNWVTLWLAFGR
jgi:hypothetical protein